MALTLHPGTNAPIHDYLAAAGHDTDESGALFRSVSNNRTGKAARAIMADGVYKLVRGYSAQFGLEIGAHALRATAATNALDHQADIANVHEWLGHANIATNRIYDHRRTRSEDSPTFQGGILMQKLTRHSQRGAARCEAMPVFRERFVLLRRSVTRSSLVGILTAVLALLALVAVNPSPAAAENSFKESDANGFLQLAKSTLALRHDINNAADILRQSREFDQASCLYDLASVLESLHAALFSAHDLVRLSAGMRDSNDEIAVNETLALNVSFEMEAMAENRRHALAQGALFSTSALVNTYSQKTAMVIDRAVVLFAAVDNRVGWLVQHKP